MGIIWLISVHVCSRWTQVAPKEYICTVMHVYMRMSKNTIHMPQTFLFLVYTVDNKQISLHEATENTAVLKIIYITECRLLNTRVYDPKSASTMLSSSSASACVRLQKYMPVSRASSAEISRFQVSQEKRAAETNVYMYEECSAHDHGDPCSACTHQWECRHCNVHGMGTFRNLNVWITYLAKEMKTILRIRLTDV